MEGKGGLTFKKFLIDLSFQVNMTHISNSSNISKGEMTWPSGDQYIGDWVNNQRLILPRILFYFYRSGHGLYLYSSGNRYKGQYLAGKKVNSMVVCHLFKAAIITKNGVILSFLTSDPLGGFWSVLVDDWDTCRGEVCRPICR